MICSICNKHFHPDEDYHMARCGGVYEPKCEHCLEQKEETVDVYKEHGYDSREEYLECLAEDHGLSLETVYALAEALGTGEDFDGLPLALEDISGFYYE